MTETAAFEAVIRKTLRYIPIPRGLRAKWRRFLLERAFKREIEAARKNADREEVERLKHDRSFEIRLLDEDEEFAYTNQLVQTARHLRVPVPPKPMPRNADEYEDSEDWDLGIEGLWFLTPQGVAKVREEIRKEEQWRRAGRANWAVFLSASAGVIGALIGLVAIFTK